jgi:ADP-heptose:LPS heptosyltransferase
MQPDRQSLLIVNFEGMGDNVLSMPFLSIISCALREYERYLLVGPGRGDLFYGWNDFHLVEAGEGEKTVAVLSRYHELIVHLGTGDDHVTDRLPQGQLKYGTYVGFTKPKSIPREIAVPRPLDKPRWQQFIALLAPLGIAADDIPEFAIQSSALSENYAEMLVNFRTGFPLVCVAPGASYDHRKRWPLACFATFMQGLHSKRPCRFALVGDRCEMQIGEAIASLVDFEIDNLMGLTTLGCLVHILKQSQLLLANDNGVMHLGGALGIPTIGLFGPSNSQVFSPLGTSSTLIVSHSGDVSDIDPLHVLRASIGLMG